MDTDAKKFNAVQSHTETGPDGHFVCIKGVPAMHGPFKALSKGHLVLAEDMWGNLRLFDRRYWVLSKERQRRI